MKTTQMDAALKDTRLGECCCPTLMENNTDGGGIINSNIIRRGLVQRVARGAAS